MNYGYAKEFLTYEELLCAIIAIEPTKYLIDYNAFIAHDNAFSKMEKRYSIFGNQSELSEFYILHNIFSGSNSGYHYLNSYKKRDIFIYELIDLALHNTILNNKIEYLPFCKNGIPYVPIYYFPICNSIVSFEKEFKTLIEYDKNYLLAAKKYIEIIKKNGSIR